MERGTVDAGAPVDDGGVPETSAAVVFSAPASSSAIAIAVEVMSFIRLISPTYDRVRHTRMMCEH
jgi:hypothetical protein